MPAPSPETPPPTPLKSRFEAAGARLRPFAVRAGDGLGRLAPVVERGSRALRKYPILAKGIDRIAATWGSLVEGFCQTIEPVLARRFPDLRLVAVADGTGGLALHRFGGGSAAALGAMDVLSPDELAALAATRWAAVELRLPAAQILERKLSLPGASRDFLRPIIEHRLERLTPWRPDKVLYGYRVLDDGAAGALAVTLVATSRDLVAVPLRRLGEAGLTPTAVGADAGAPDAPLAVNLLTAGAAVAPRSESRRFVSRVALATLGGLFVVYLGTASMASNATSDQESSSRKLVKARRLLRAASMGEVGSRERALLDAKQPGRSTMVLVDRLATSIPADTFLKELTVAPDKVRLVGTSGNAPALVGKLEAAGLDNVRFTSAITRDKSGRDDFEIGADRPAPKPEEAP